MSGVGEMACVGKQLTVLIYFFGLSCQIMMLSYALRTTHGPIIFSFLEIRSTSSPLSMLDQLRWLVLWQSSQNHSLSDAQLHICPFTFSCCNSFLVIGKTRTENWRARKTPKYKSSGKSPFSLSISFFALTETSRIYGGELDGWSNGILFVHLTIRFKIYSTST